MGMPALFLASNSPRRRQLLSWTGWDFQVSPVAIDETPRPGEDPAAYVSRLAHTKGDAQARQVRAAGSLVLSADTIVADGLTLLGKPVDPQEAVSMLQRLRGHSHQVYTAIELITSGAVQSGAERCASDCPMRDYTDAEIAGVCCQWRPTRQSRCICHPTPRLSSGGRFQRLFCQCDGSAALPPGACDGSPGLYRAGGCTCRLPG